MQRDGILDVNVYNVPENIYHSCPGVGGSYVRHCDINVDKDDQPPTARTNLIAPGEPDGD